MAVCPSCERENPEGFGYCGFCGSPLAAASLYRLKLATLVFSDLAGSTALGERIEPETMRTLMHSYFREMRDALGRHGGTVEKFVGDAVLGVFGVPEAHEDDALRACRAALEMQARVAALNEELERRFGTRIAARIGVNSGVVVADGTSTDETFVTGDAVNVAARLEQAAGPGEVLLGEATHRLVRDAVTVEPVEPVAAAGKSTPLVAYRLLGAAASAPAATGHAVALVGRERELALLEQEFADVVAGRRCRLVTVVGEPGVGKSRLTAEFAGRVAERATVVRGGCLSYGEGITYWAVGQIVRALAGIHDEDSRDEALARIEASAARLPAGAVVAAMVAQLLGLSEVSAAAVETDWAIRQFLSAQAHERPLVVFVDDVHWAEPGLLELLAGMPAGIEDAPVLVVCCARPELLEARPGWQVEARLEPLPAPAVDALLEGLLGAVPADLRARLATASGGNPLFLEELVAMLLDEGVLQVDDGVCTLAGELEPGALPPSLHALLGARLDRLEPHARAVLERGAVEGEVFHVGAVEELCELRLRPFVTTTLDALAGRDVVRGTEPLFAGETAFRFKHILVRDAAYASAPKGLRAALHEQFAAWLERVAGEHATEFAEILGYHLERSYRYRTELGPADERARTTADRAGRWLAVAGQRALDRGDDRAASTLFASAAALTADGFRRTRYALLHGRAAREAMDYETARDVLAGVRADAAAAGWEMLAAGAEVELGMMALHTATDTTARLREAAGRALATFEEFGDDAGTAGALALLAWERWLLLRCGEAEELFQQALEPALRSGDQRLTSSLLVDLARATLFGPRPAADALARCEVLLERARTLGPMAAASISTMISVLEAELGNAERARRFADEGRAVLEEVAPDAALSFGHYAGYALLMAGDAQSAEQELRSLGERLRERGERGIASTVASLRARALVELGRHEEAEQAALLGLELADADDVLSHSYAHGALARSRAARGSVDAAVESARMAVRLASGTDLPDARGDALLDLALVLEASGDAAAARTAAAEALGVYRAKGNVASAERAARLLG